MNMTFENVIVPLAKSCSDNLFQQIYYMTYMQEAVNDLQNAEVMAFQNCELGEEK
ncbi:hypothetical protein ACRBU7_03980 [Priestia aryabhattai]|uniref:hypothetical protein n=1 Tax=Priestia aryabhattai TaxID=412384 RepID=UPI003D7FD1A1